MYEQQQHAYKPFFQLHKDYQKWMKHVSWAPDCMRDDSSHISHTMPYLPTSTTNKTGQAVSSSSSTASELLVSVKFTYLILSILI